MIRTIKKLCLSDENVCLYSNSEDISGFTFGRFIACDDSFFAFEMVTPNGNPDGVLVKEIDKVYRVEKNSKYCRKMEIIMEACKCQMPDYSIDDHDVVGSIMEKAQSTKRVVSIELLNSGKEDIVGFVENLTTEQYVIRQYDEYGEEDGISYIKKEDISQISFDSEDEIRLLRIIRYANGGLS